MAKISQAAAIIFILSLFASGVTAYEYCDNVWVDMEDVTVSENSTEYFDFQVYNDEDRDFDIQDVRVRESPSLSGISLSISRNPRDVDFLEYETGRIRITTGSFSSDRFLDGIIEVRGRFSGGKYCGFADTENTGFNIDIENRAESGTCSKIEVFAQNTTIREDDVIFGEYEIKNDSSQRFYIDAISITESSPYISVRVESKEQYINGDERSYFVLRIESNNITRDRTATVRVKVKGHFAGRDCSYTQTGEDSFVVAIKDAEAGFSGTGSCRHLRISVNDVKVGVGEEAEENFIVENNSGERFYIDYVRVSESSPNFRAESNGFDKIVYANGIGLVGIKINAYGNAYIGRERASISIRGHFVGGNSCSLSSSERDFYVRIVEPGESNYSPPVLPSYSSYCPGFVFSAPRKKTIDGSGTVELKIENNTGNRAHIRISGTGANAGTALISVPNGFKSNSYSVNVFAGSGIGTVYYEIDTGNCLSKKSTTIVQDNTGQEQEEDQPTGESQDLFGTVVTTGFAALSGAGVSNTAKIFAALVIIIAAFYILKKQNSI